MSQLWSPAVGDVNFPGLAPDAIDGMTIGGTTPDAGTFTTLSSIGLTTAATLTSTGLATMGSAKLDTGTKTATATAGAATLNKSSGVITTEALTTAPDAGYGLTLTNSTIANADQVFVSVAFGTANQGNPFVSRVTPSAGSVFISILNGAGASLNGTLKISFMVLKN